LDSVSNTSDTTIMLNRDRLENFPHESAKLSDHNQDLKVRYLIDPETRSTPCYKL
jgi:hypothetical protein